MQRIKQMEEDYETAVRLFYCRPPSPTPSHMSAAAEQPTSGLQRAAAAQSTSCLQTAAAAAEQSKPGLQPAAEFPEGPEGGLPPRPGPEHLLGFLWGVLTELRPDAQPDSPQPGMTPDPKSASTSSTRHRERRKRGASAQFIEDLGDASAHPTEGLRDASAPAHATEGLGDASAPAHVTEGPADASAPAPSLQAFQGFSEKLVLGLASEACNEGFEEEAQPDLEPLVSLLLVMGFRTSPSPPDNNIIILWII
ncbi:hypothetical protein CRENBAI_006724 [Crenichthys baileyi]|uniref:Uncharacterized protein n=1 Tax=Crenichthys baileyi TaxID=28760 RepID=A0AAV9S1F5_9TELE